MELNKKFKNIIHNYIGSEWDRRDVSDMLEKEAEDFAIGFAKWMYDYKGDINKVEELLEIYKKEKGL